MIFYRKGKKGTDKKGKDLMYNFEHKINFAVFPSLQVSLVIIPLSPLEPYLVWKLILMFPVFTLSLVVDFAGLEIIYLQLHK